MPSFWRSAGGSPSSWPLHPSELGSESAIKKLVGGRGIDYLRSVAKRRPIEVTWPYNALTRQFADVRELRS
jgi:hypothetical protein